LSCAARLLGNQKKWIFRKLMIDSGELKEKDGDKKIWFTAFKPRAG
jgi:hypothetical protein